MIFQRIERIGDPAKAIAETHIGFYYPVPLAQRKIKNRINADGRSLFFGITERDYVNGNAGARVMITVFPGAFAGGSFAEIKLERSEMLLNKMSHIVAMAPEKSVLDTSAD